MCKTGNLFCSCWRNTWIHSEVILLECFPHWFFFTVGGSWLIEAQWFGSHGFEILINDYEILVASFMSFPRFTEWAWNKEVMHIPV